ncbi:hypothetical protein D9613_011778 [Agrocybe pediades]|uniref:Nephrocystin 3-like N-terminal domain-containing protein n=1 Tax=Agrocybe pediades TaxID=84607 RepID=A0A8H4VIZ6_9AGAR|nr:hypothetical protein D9613_011778 [Agrocybe pediades]
MKGKFKKFKVPNLRSLWSRRPSQDLLSVHPAERSTDSRSAPTTESPKDSRSASTTESPQGSQSAPPTERPSDPGSALQTPAELSTNSQSAVPPTELPTKLHSTHPTEIRTLQSEPDTKLGPTDSGVGAGGQKQAENLAEKLGSLLWKTTQTALRLLEQNSDGFPPLKTAVGVLVTCLDLTQDVIGNREEYDKLAIELKDMATTLAPYAQKLVERGEGGSVALILKSINEELAQIKDKLERGKFRRAIEAREDQDDIIERYRKIDSLFRRLLNDITLRTHIEIGKLCDATDATLLRTLDPAYDARYNSAYSTTVKRRGCTASTREQILQELRTWADNPTSAKVFWLNGMAGTGKTTILYTFCQWLEDHSRLGGNFFCSRYSASCRDLNKILPSLAYQVAHYSPAFRSKLCTILEDQQSPQTLNVGSQFKWVIEMPFEKSKEAIPEGVVIVVDALDECENASETRLFLETLLKFASQLPVKFIIASRPEPIIVAKMQSPGFLPSTFRLHDIEQSLVEADIRKYLEEALSTMDPIPSSEQIGQITERSGKLFIYAATVARYINPEDPTIDSSGRLETILDNASNSVGSNLRYKELDTLYLNIVSSALAEEKLERKELDTINLIVRTVVCAMEPLTIKTMSTMLALDQVQIKKYISRLHSVLHVQQGDTGHVSVLHASFPDFMFDKSRSLRFHCDPGEFHASLSCFCFGVMEKELRFNICDLETSFVFDSDVPNLQQKIKENISDALFYSCKYWGNHLVKGNFAEDIHTKLVHFLETRLLFWIEVINVKRHITTGPKILSNALRWLRVNGYKASDTKKKLYDAQEFVEAFSMNACNKSTPHIYISALPFCYKSNFVYANYWTKTQGLVSINGSSVEEKLIRPIATWHMGSKVVSLAVSHDGTSFATGSFQDGIRIYDADSGEIIAGPFRAHQGDPGDPYYHDIAGLVTLSPDNTKIAAADRSMIIIWDIQTGNLMAGQHSTQLYSRVTSLSFSLDSKKLVSVDDDKTIIVWDTATGDVISGPFQSTARVNEVGFTPDGLKIVSVSASDNYMICVWDSEKGTALSALSKPIGDEYIWSAALSSDRSNIAMGFFSGAISIVDASTGAVVIGPFACNERVEALTFSHDDKKLFSRHDSGFRVWDAQTGILEAHLVSKSTPDFFVTTLTPDGNNFKIIAVRSTREIIDVWSTINDDTAGPSFLSAQGSTVKPVESPVCSLAYSLDGRVIAAGFEDGHVGLWDAQTGKEVLRPFKAYTDFHVCVSFSSDGTTLATSCDPGWSLSWDTDNEPVRLWNARTGKMIAELLLGPSEKLGSVNELSYSKDGSMIAWPVYRVYIPPPKAVFPPKIRSSSSSFEEYEVMSEDDDTDPEQAKVFDQICEANTTVIWDLRSGRIIGKPMQGYYTEGAMSISFSPDNTVLILGNPRLGLIIWSIDDSKVIWEEKVEPAAFAISMAFSRDGTRFASGSSDGALCLWNIRTTPVEMIPLPWRGHSEGSIASIAFLPDGDKVLTVTADSSYGTSICSWDVETGDILGIFGIPLLHRPVVISPDCSQLALYEHENQGISTRSIRIYEVENALATGWQGMTEEDIMAGFDNEDRSDSTFYLPLSVKLAMSRIAQYDHVTGWMTVDDRNVFWIWPDFLGNLCYAYNSLTIGPYGTTFMDYSSMNLCIGKKWVNCWLTK